MSDTDRPGHLADAPEAGGPVPRVPGTADGAAGHAPDVGRHALAATEQGWSPDAAALREEIEHDRRSEWRLPAQAVVAAVVTAAITVVGQMLGR